MTYQKRQPFVWFAAYLSLGIFIYSFVPASSLGVGTNSVYSSWLVILILAFPIYLSQWFGRLGKGISSLMIIACTGYLVSFLNDTTTDKRHIIHNRETIFAYEARVHSQPEQRKKSFRFEAVITRIRTETGWHPTAGTVLIYLDRGAAQKPRYGERWLIKGAPQLVEGPRNPGQFNYRQYLASQHIFHRHFLKAAERTLLAYEPDSRLTSAAYKVNSWADSTFTQHLGATQEFAIVKAMVLGIRDTIEPELQNAYSAAGAVHVLSVSGLHVGIFFWVLERFLRFIRRRKNGNIVFFIVITATLWFYAIMTGLSAPVLRSVVMFNLLLLADVLNRRHTLVNTLAASAFLILLFEPEALFAAGFQLSYLAVGSLALWQRSLSQCLVFRNRLLNHLWEITSVALIAQLATFPVGIYYFHQFPTYFLLANPFVIPLSSIVLVLAFTLLALSWLPLLSPLIGAMLYGSMWLLNRLVEWINQLPYSVIDALTLTLSELFLLMSLLIVGITMIVRRRRQLVISLLFISFLLSISLWRTVIAREKQKILVVYAGQKELLIGLIGGTQMELLHTAHADSLKSSINFNVKGCLDSLGISVSKVHFSKIGSSGTLRLWHGNSIAVLTGPLKSFTNKRPIPVDYLVVTRNAVRSGLDLSKGFVAQKIIFDDSNGYLRTKRIIAEARKIGLDNIHWTRDRGAFITRID